MCKQRNPQLRLSPKPLRTRGGSIPMQSVASPNDFTGSGSFLSALIPVLGAWKFVLLIHVMPVITVAGDWFILLLVCWEMRQLKLLWFKEKFNFLPRASLGFPPSINLDWLFWLSLEFSAHCTALWPISVHHFSLNFGFFSPHCCTSDHCR